MQGRTLCSRLKFDVNRDAITVTSQLETCAVPSIEYCNNTDLSPAWVEPYAKAMLDEQNILISNFSSNCKALFMRMWCSLPTCGDNNQLYGVTRRETCEEVIKW